MLRRDARHRRRSRLSVRDGAAECRTAAATRRSSAVTSAYSRRRRRRRARDAQGFVEARHGRMSTQTTTVVDALPSVSHVTRCPNRTLTVGGVEGYRSPVVLAARRCNRSGECAQGSSSASAMSTQGTRHDGWNPRFDGVEPEGRAPRRTSKGTRCRTRSPSAAGAPRRYEPLVEATAARLVASLALRSCWYEPFPFDRQLHVSNPAASCFRLQSPASSRGRSAARSSSRSDPQVSRSAASSSSRSHRPVA